MRRKSGQLATVLAVLVTLWLLWSKLHIVIFVPLPWWGLLLIGLGIFIALDYLFDQLFNKRAP